MTVTVKGLNCAETESLVHSAKTKFYPADIPAQHHQLRHLVSTAEKDRIYYVNGFDIYTLELSTCQRSLIATLPFTARCLAARYGWICVGGESEGYCAFLKIEREAASIEEGEPAGVLGRPKCFGHELTVKKLEGEIVNSMNIHRLSHGSSPGETETVVLISNNDKTVKIYSLNQQKVLNTLRHLVPMNYASISPDSKLLVAVGDSNRISFYKRETVSETYPTYNWRIFTAPRVPVNGPENDDHSFSIAFSPDGDLCAVSSQGGVITIFELALLERLAEERNSEAAILCSFRSTREPILGSVRSMAFSPKPWDLLAWAEDHGRVGVADIRQHFIRRQVLRLDNFGQGLKIEVEDVTPSEYSGLNVKERLKKQYLERLNFEHGPDETSVADVSPGDPWAEEARMRQVRRQPLSSHQGLELDSRERSVLETLEIPMDNGRHSTLDPRHPYSVSYTSSPRVRPSADNASGNLERYAERSYRSDRSYMPRRRTSVVLSPSRTDNEIHPSTLAPRDSSRTRLTASPSPVPHLNDRPTLADDLPTLMSTDDVMPTIGGSTSQPLRYDIPPSDPWSTIQSALETARAVDNDMATLRRLEETLDRERDAIFQPARSQPVDSGSRGEDSASAETSALPTTIVRPTEHTEHVMNTLRRHEDIQRRQLAHLDVLERQFRRAESRAAIASSEIEALENAIMRGANGDRHARIVEARAHSRARAAAVANARAESGQNPTSREELRRNAERYLSNRASENRMQMLYRTRAGQAIDQNGNWIAPRSGLGAVGLRRTELDELERERGLGSTGVGWSPDGSTLFCGSEQGIFEFKVNVRDRMQFPSCELR